MIGVSNTASPRGSIALYRAGQALAGLLGRDYVIPDDIKALAEPALAHRLIIKTSSSIHDVQAGQVVRDLLESTAIDGIRPTGGGPTELRAAGADDMDAEAPQVAKFFRFRFESYLGPRFNVRRGVRKISKPHRS
jgi:Mg-chelatase subunit ChlI